MTKGVCSKSQMLFLVEEKVRQKMGQLRVGAARLALDLAPGAAEREEGTWVCLRIRDVHPCPGAEPDTFVVKSNSLLLYFLWKAKKRISD